MNSENIINIEFEDKIIITFIPSDQEFANKPDIIRLVDCNRRPPEPKYKNDENILGNFVTEYRQIDTGTSILDQFIHKVHNFHIFGGRKTTKSKLLLENVPVS